MGGMQYPQQQVHQPMQEPLQHGSMSARVTCSRRKLQLLRMCSYPSVDLRTAIHLFQLGSVVSSPTLVLGHVTRAYYSAHAEGAFLMTFVFSGMLFRR